MREGVSRMTSTVYGSRCRCRDGQLQRTCIGVRCRANAIMRHE